MNHPELPQEATQSSAVPQPRYRSGAVARMAGMPVSTLRIWEQRYRAVGPSTAPTGHRLYSAADVERVILLRQLTEQGHAIGSLAALDMAQLRSVAHTQADAASQGRAEVPSRPQPLRVVVVGQAMARRFQRAAVFRHWPSPPQVVGVFDSLSEAVKARQAPTGQTTAPVDLLLWQAASVQESEMPELQAAQLAWRPGALAVAYRFAGPSVRSALVATGAVVARVPADDEALGAWLWSLPAVQSGGAGEPAPAGTHTGMAPPRDIDPWSPVALGLTERAAPLRRFDDAALTEFAGLSTNIACECPAHVAELLMQIASFEAYSADCAHRSPADAALHAYLQRVAGAARVLFESALERVAVAEGWALPDAGSVHPVRA